MRYFALFALLIACDDAHTSSDPPLPDGRVRDAMSAPPLDARVRPTEDAQPPGKPDALSPDALSPDALSPDALSPDALSPDALSPDALSPDALSPDAAASTCGNGVREGDEICDEGPLNGQLGHCGARCSSPPWRAMPDLEGIEGLETAALPECDPQRWFNKALLYRARLRGEGTAAYPGFISIGPGPGQSIPAAHRVPTTDCNNDWWLSDSQCVQREGRGKLNWGDASLWLGEYIAMLAAERAVFVQHGLDPAPVDHDLFYALAAFNRIDEAAEIPFGAPPIRDGFFLRDDVPADVVFDASGGLRFPGYACARAVGACRPPSVENGAYVSQDQVTGLIFGMALVHRLVPSGVVVEGVDLRQEAAAITHRMINHLRAHGWRVMDPTGESPPDQWGGNALGFSDLFARAANHICEGRFGIEDYRDDRSETLGRAAFQGMLAIWDVTHGYNRTMALRLMAIVGGWEADEMASRSVEDHKEIYALAYALIHNARLPAPFSRWRMERILDSAPCGGPCYNVEGCEEAPGWRGEHRWTGPGDRNGCKHHREAEFNGLDYLLLHHLYLLYQGGEYGGRTPSSADMSCDGMTDLDAILAGQVIEVYEPCLASDMSRRFCGRPWSAWLADAFAGEVTIFTGGVGGRRWDCVGQTCALVEIDYPGTGGADLILGTPGDDHLRGGDGDDCIYGFGGADVLRGERGNDVLYGGEGDDEIYGEMPGAISGEIDVLYGEGGADTLKGGPGADELYGGEGADTLIGDGGDDLIEGGPGDDEAHGDSGEDVIHGNDGDDTLIGDAGDDALYGQAGRDKLDGEGGDDWLFGGAGDNLLKGGDGSDRLFASGDAERLCGNGGDDELWGDWDGDACLGGGWFMGGDDTVNGCEDGTASEDDCDNSAFEDW